MRLLGPLSSYSAKLGEKVRAIVIESPECEGVETIAAGVVVEGEVQAARRVGMGLVHETALLKLNFRAIVTKDGGRVPLTTRLIEIDNAREKVKGGVIHGVNATDTPQGRISGGLVRLPKWDPYTSMALLVYRATFPFNPEPEIYLPRGTDLKLEMAEDAEVPESLRGIAAPEDVAENADLAKRLASSGMPERTTTVRGHPADVVNLALLGTREEIEAAFRAAGWSNGAPLTTKTAFRDAQAIVTFQNYAEAPMSRQLMDQQQPAMTWEKGLDSFPKREHLRVWPRNDVIDGQTVWLAAMTRETGISLSLRQRKFIHRIDPDLDAGRALVVRDLNLAGCVESVRYAQRPQAAHMTTNATGDPMLTDGALAVVQLKDCENPVFEHNVEGPQIATRPRWRFARYLRMQVLNIKTDLVRGNILYATYDATRMMLHARRERAEKAMLARQGATKPMPREGVMGDADAPTPSSFLDGD